MTDPECRYCHRPVYYDALDEDRPWNLVYIEYSDTRWCDGSDTVHDPEVTHLQEEPAGLFTDCCSKSLYELPQGDRLTGIPELVTCGKLPDKEKESR